MVRDSVGGRVIITITSMSNEIEDQEHTTRSDAINEAFRGEFHVLEVMEAQANHCQVEIEELRPVQRLRRPFLLKQIADHCVSVQLLCILGLVRAKSQIVGLDHVVTEVDTNILCGTSTESVGDGSRSASIVQDADLFSCVGRPLEARRRVHKVNSNPIDIGEDEFGNLVDHVFLPLLSLV